MLLRAYFHKEYREKHLGFLKSNKYQCLNIDICIFAAITEQITK